MLAAAAAHGVPFLELRAISNPVGPRDRAGWDLPGALARLGPAVRAPRRGAPSPIGRRAVSGVLSLAHSPCPNDTFVFHAWSHGLVPGAPPVEVTFADVDVTNTAAERGAFDVVKVSYAALPWLLARLRAAAVRRRARARLRPAGGHRRPGRDLAGATVAVPGDRTTAYLLFRLWSAAAPPARVDVVPFAEIMPAVRAGRYDAGLVIHEARFTYQRYGLTCRADLGSWWEAETGLPIPLGAILARRRLDTARLAAVVRESVERAWADPAASADYVARHAAEMDPRVQRQHVQLYVNGFTADLGEEGRAAVRTLLDRAAAAGITPSLSAAGADSSLARGHPDTRARFGAAKLANGPVRSSQLLGRPPENSRCLTPYQ